MKKNKSLIIILLIVVIGIVGLTLAYFANTANITNEFKSKEYGTTVTEVFESPENWLPGSTEPKTLTVTNSGQVDEAVRVSYTEVWTSKNAKNNNQEGDLSLTQGENRAAIINFSDNEDWTPVTENNKIYYYYNYKLAPGETTSTLLDSVTFNKDIVNTNNCVETKTATGKKVECTSDGAGYDGATYKLIFKVETVQYDKYEDAWGTDASIANSSKPLMVKGLKVNSVDKTYETGDQSEMFAFSHPETEQMKATTDYRYIGNIPNNYVKFNCDNDGTNCEIWRIIGVFEVDDGNGNYQQRIKLVRGTVLEEKMKFDDREYEDLTGDWSKSTLQEFLNSSYLNQNGDAVNYGLKELARSQISDAKYYLAEVWWMSKPDNSGTDEIYIKERGIDRYNDTRSLNWTGLVGLIYPSDYVYTYARGVDNVCYDNPFECYETGPEYTGDPRQNGYPESSWIYNSYIEINNYNTDIWLLNPTINDHEVWILKNSGRFEQYGVFHSEKSFVPVVYLKPSINITGGDGSENNPYTLSAN